MSQREKEAVEKGSQETTRRENPYRKGSREYFAYSEAVGENRKRQGLDYDESTEGNPTWG